MPIGDSFRQTDNVFLLFSFAIYRTSVRILFMHSNSGNQSCFSSKCIQSFSNFSVVITNSINRTFRIYVILLEHIIRNCHLKKI